jgi:Rad3-related DNA helicase
MIQASTDTIRRKNYRKNQENIIKQIENCIKNRQHYILNSGTGSGKTIMAIEPILNAVVKFRLKAICIAQTYSQNDRIIEESQGYVDQIKHLNCNVNILQLKGKAKLCPILNELQDETIQNELEYNFHDMCEKNRETDSCSYYHIFKNQEKINAQINQFLKSNSYIFDSDTINKYCIQKRICPYFFLMKLLPHADIIIGNYFWLLHPQVRSLILTRSEIKFSETIVFFDEIHNLVDRACEIKSFNISKKTIEKTIKLLSEIEKFATDLFTAIELSESKLKLDKNNEDYDKKKEERGLTGFFSENGEIIRWKKLLNEMIQLIQSANQQVSSILKNIENFIYQMVNAFSDYKKKKWDQGNQIEIPSNSDIKNQFINQNFIELIEKMTEISEIINSDNLQIILKIPKEYESHFKRYMALISLHYLKQEYGEGISNKKFNFLSIYNFSNKFNEINQSIGKVDSESKIPISRNTYCDFINVNKKNNNDIDFNWRVVCNDARLILKPIIDNCYSTIGASGTFIENYCDILGFPKERKYYHNKEQFSKENMLVINDTSLNTRHPIENRMYDDYVDRIVKYCNTIPGNIGIFCPSYEICEEISSRLKQTQSLFKKKLYIDANSSDKIYPALSREKFIENYKAESNLESGVEDGAVLITPCNGKYSEGEDYPKGQMRAVIIVGLPIPPQSIALEGRKQLFYEIVRDKNDRPLPWVDALVYKYIVLKTISQNGGRPKRANEIKAAVIIMDRDWEKYYHNMIKKLIPQYWNILKMDNHLDVVNTIQTFFGISDEATLDK